MAEIQDLTDLILTFRKERDWEQFHNPKDSALSLVLEATELLEHMQWKNGEELTQYIKSHKKEIGDELADVLFWVLLMSHDLGINIITASKKKLRENKKKYPVKKIKGKSVKYTNLR